MTKDPLHGYPPTSIGGQAIQRGRDKFDRKEYPYLGWPFLERRGWYDRKAEAEQGTFQTEHDHNGQVKRITLTKGTAIIGGKEYALSNMEVTLLDSPKDIPPRV